MKAARSNAELAAAVVRRARELRRRRKSRTNPALGTVIIVCFEGVKK